MDCLFCSIAKKEIPSAAVYEDDEIFAFRDINPQAPVHEKKKKKKHIAGMDEVTAENSDVISKIF